MKELQTEILIVGGGTGGCAAALAACAMGRRVIMTEPTAWIGGQLTSQAVPPDENEWIEAGGATARYRAFRDDVRAYYRSHYPLTPAARAQVNLNPGNGAVSRLCHEFRVGVAVLEARLSSYRSTRQLLVLPFTEPVAATTDADRVTSVTVRDTRSGDTTVITATYFLDATELGDLLPLTKTEYVTGFESQAMTGEPSAPAEYQPLNMQAVSWCFAIDHLPGENHVIDKPEQYDFWRQHVPAVTPAWGSPILSWYAPLPRPVVSSERQFLPSAETPQGRGTHWCFRRIAHVANFEPGTYASDIVLVNWPQLDYMLGPIMEVPEVERRQHLHGARQLALALMYWMQTEAPRQDGSGKTGFPGLRLRGDVVGDTPDGLAMQVYVREARRIQAVFTVCEQHVAQAIRGAAGAERFADTVGIGHYNIDLHPSTGGDNYIDVPACRFQIPLGALLPRRVRNLLPACKNIGTTHITNGCYRLHPVEWNIGEAAGVLAGFCLQRQSSPHAVRETPALLRDFQQMLGSQGVKLGWPALP